jgi:hypothetical protein
MRKSDLSKEPSEKDSRKRTARDLADENFSRIGALVAAIQNSTNDSDVVRYAKEYKLIMVCSLAEDTSYRADKAIIEEKGKAIGINELYKLFQEHLPKLRNLLADHFHRMNIEHHLALNDALVDFNLLERINSSQSSSRMRRTLTTLIAFINDEIPQIKKHLLTYVQRSQLIVDYLRKSLAFLQQDSNASQEDTVYAVALLHIASGTCARELLVKLEAEEPHLQEGLVDQLSILKIIRDDFAHKRTLQERESIRKAVIKLPSVLPKLIQGMQNYMPEIWRILKVSSSMSVGLPSPILSFAPTNSSDLMLLSTTTIHQNVRDVPEADPVRASDNIAQTSVVAKTTDAEPNLLDTIPSEGQFFSSELPEQQPSEKLLDQANINPLGGPRK